jgi:hypothetical protein
MPLPIICISERLQPYLMSYRDLFSKQKSQVLRDRRVRGLQ